MLIDAVVIVALVMCLCCFSPSLLSLNCFDNLKITFATRLEGGSLNNVDSIDSGINELLIINYNSSLSQSL